MHVRTNAEEKCWWLCFADLKNQQKKKKVEVNISKQELWDRTETLWKSPELTIAVYQNYDITSFNVQKPYLALFISLCIVLNKMSSKTESSSYIICLIHASLPAGRFFFFFFFSLQLWWREKYELIWVEQKFYKKEMACFLCYKANGIAHNRSICVKRNILLLAVILLRHYWFVLAQQLLWMLSSSRRLVTDVIHVLYIGKD